MINEMAFFQTHTCEDVDLNVTIVKKYLESVTERHDMNAHSVLLFNAGAHYVKVRRAMTSLYLMPNSCNTAPYGYLA